MKRIIPFSLYLLLVMPVALFANLHYNTPKENTDTSTYNTGNSKSLILHGSLSAFNAAYGKNYFELNWNTIAGDFDHFEIERSLDGLKYETIGTVSNKEVVSNEGLYAFRDHFHSAVARNNDFYYRLKEFESNGNIIYSKVLIARMFNTKSLASLSVTPDPLANDILVNVQLNEDSYVMMKVIDEQGNLLLKEGQKAAYGPNTFTLEGTHGLHSGLYTLEVTVNSKERMIMKLSKG
ncbi:MAG TPA: hypothetical protein VGZ90_17420 [Puia sp.]|jgi:hypothetical protein|nr:hypothetical protein [Puia sp.]